MDIKTDVNDVLRDMATMAQAAAQNGGEEALKLANYAAALTQDVIAMKDPREKLQALESIGHGMKSGLAAIANKEARALLGSILGRSLDFAKTILGGLLGMF